MSLEMLSAHPFSRREAVLLAVGLIAEPALTSPVLAASTIDATSELRSAVAAYMSVWGPGTSPLDWARISEMYDKRPGSYASFNLLPPLDGYRDWAAFQEGMRRTYAGYRSFSLETHSDLRARRLGHVAWTALGFTVHAVTSEGSALPPLQGRVVNIWRRDRSRWRIVHEHVSLAATTATRVATLAQSPRASTGPVERFRPLLKAYYVARTQSDQAVLNRVLLPAPERMILPAFPSSPAFSGDLALLHPSGVATARYSCNLDEFARVEGDTAWTLGTYRYDLTLAGGSERSGDARQTTVWVKSEDGWRIALIAESVQLAN